MPDKVKMIPLDKVVVEDRARADLHDINGLAESLKDKGMLQSVTVAPLDKGNFRLLAGGRRIAAARLAGLKQVPAVIRDSADEVDWFEVELIENVWREDLLWPEKAKLIKKIDDYCRTKNIGEWNQRRTAQLMGMGLGSVNREIQLASALEVIPELGEKAETQDQAFKMLKQLEENSIVGELRKRQLGTMNEGAINRGLADMLKIADANYRIGDVFAGMAELRSNGMINLIECDPPYAIDLNTQKRGNEEPTSSARSYHEVPTEAYEGFLSRLSKELYRVAGEHCWLVFWYGPTWHTEVKKALKEAGWKVDDIPCIWHKGHGQTMQPAFNLGRSYEPFFLARKGIPAIIKQGRSNVFEFPPVPAQKKYHPTERPLGLMESIVETLIPTRAVCLVPFVGSGVTLRACYKQGVACWGYDISGEYKDKFMLAVEADTKALSEEEPEPNRAKPEGVRRPWTEEEKEEYHATGKAPSESTTTYEDSGDSEEYNDDIPF